jgi:hypothetical protein
MLEAPRNAWKTLNVTAISICSSLASSGWSDTISLIAGRVGVDLAITEPRRRISACVPVPYQSKTNMPTSIPGRMPGLSRS